MKHLFLFLLILLGLPAAEPEAAVKGHVPVLLQLKEPALVPFFLDQKALGIEGEALGQAVQHQNTRLANEQERLTKRLTAAKRR